MLNYELELSKEAFRLPRKGLDKNNAAAMQPARDSSTLRQLHVDEDNRFSVAVERPRCKAMLRPIQQAQPVSEPAVQPPGRL